MLKFSFKLKKSLKTNYATMLHNSLKMCAKYEKKTVNKRM